MDKYKERMLNIIDVLQSKDRKKRILVLGDAIFDNYIIGDVIKISPEAQVPVLSNINIDWKLGGAANVFNNIISLGGNANICTLLGNDFEGKLIRSKLCDINNNVNLIYVDTMRRTTKKTRYLTKDKKHLLRVDEEIIHPIEKKEAAYYIVNEVKKRIEEFDILVISDYAKGLITEYLIKQIIDMFNKNNKIILTDPKSKDITLYRDSYLIKPNKNEFINFINTKKRSVNNRFLVKQGKKLLEKSNAEYIYVTLGKKGGVLIGRGKKPLFIKAHGKTVIDITGAGDAVIASIATALSAGIGIREAIEFSTYVAGACIQEIGTTPFNLNDIKKLI